jgi:hypothetical protein
MTATTNTPGLAGRAINAARRYRAAERDAFHHRHHDWPLWTRRAATVRAIAAALGVPVDHVTVTDDPDRRYGLARQVPGDLITVTDPDTGGAWRFVPDLATFGDGWLLLDECPGCGGTVPLARVATVADLGDWLDPNNDKRYDHLPAEEHGDPGHRPHCPHSGPSTTT